MEAEVDKTLHHQRGETEERPHRQAAGLVALAATDRPIAKPENQSDRQYAHSQPDQATFNQGFEVVVFGVSPNVFIRRIATTEGLHVLKRPITGPPNGKILH